MRMVFVAGTERAQRVVSGEDGGRVLGGKVERSLATRSGHRWMMVVMSWLILSQSSATGHSDPVRVWLLLVPFCFSDGWLLLLVQLDQPVVRIDADATAVARLVNGQVRQGGRRGGGKVRSSAFQGVHLDLVLLMAG